MSLFNVHQKKSIIFKYIVTHISLEPDPGIYCIHISHVFKYNSTISQCKIDMNNFNDVMKCAFRPHNQLYNRYEM